MNPVVASWASSSSIRSRIDAEFYTPEALRKAQWIDDGTHEVRRLQDCLSLLTDGVHETPGFVDAGVMYLTASNIDECELNPGKGHKIISEATYIRYDRMKCAPKAGDVLLSKSGRIGYAAVVPAGLRFAVLHSAAILRPASIDAHFLAAFLHSRHGQDQIDRFQKGAVQPMLHLEEIAEIRVPKGSPNILSAIGNKLRKAERVRRLAVAARQRITDWIELQASGGMLSAAARRFLDHYPAATIADWTWVRSLPTADRIDPWPYHVAPRTIVGHLTAHGTSTRLANLAKRATSSRRRITFTDRNAPGHYISVLDIGPTGAIDWSNAQASRYEGAGIELKPGDILFSCINPNQPRVAVIPAGVPGLLVGSPEFAVLNPSAESSSRHPNLFATVLRSEWVRVQVTFRTRSSSLSRRRIEEHDLDDVLIPWFEDDLEELEALAVHMISGGIEATRLIAEATLLVDQFIEGTGDEGALIAESDSIERWLAENPIPNQEE